MEIETRLLDLLVEWDEAVQAGRSVSVELLVPDDPVMQQKLREAIRQQGKLRHAFNSANTVAHDPTTDAETTEPIEFPGFRSVREIGRGGMGIVFEAVDERLNRKVAIKTMRPDIARRGGAAERFLQEARLAASIKSDHVVIIHQVDVADGRPFIAMEYLRGQPLNAWMKENRPTTSQLMRIGYEAATGLAAAHDSNLIHRDIKPANIWLEAPNGRVKILDFGLARTVESDFRLTSSGIVVGTPAYMSPEQARNEPLDARSDLFSLGAILYQLATGGRPYPGKDPFAILESLYTHTPPPAWELNPEIGPALSALIDRLIQKNPADRPASARAVAEELRRIHRQSSALPTAVPVEYVATPLESEPMALWSAIAVEDDSPSVAVPPKEVGRRWPYYAIIACSFMLMLLSTAALVKLLTSKPQPDVVEEKKKNPAPAMVKEQPLSKAKPTEAVVPLIAPTPPVRPATIQTLDHLDFEKHVPPAERLPGQPKELVAVIGTHRLRLWSEIDTIKVSPDGKWVLAETPRDEYARLIHFNNGPREQRVPRATGFTPDSKRLFHGKESFPFDTPLENIKKYPIDGHLVEFITDDLVLTAEADLRTNLALVRLVGDRAEVVLKYPQGNPVAVSPNRKWLALLMEKGAVRVYRLDRDFEKHYDLPDPATVPALVLGNDRLLVGISGNVVQFWQLGDAAPVQLPITAAAWNWADRIQLSPDGRYFKQGGSILDLDAKPVKVIATDASGGFEQQYTPHLTPKQFVTMNQNGVYWWNVDGERIVNTHGPGWIHSSRHNTRQSISPDGRWLSFPSRKGPTKAFHNLFDFADFKDEHWPNDVQQLTYSAFDDDASRLVLSGFGNPGLSIKLDPKLGVQQIVGQRRPLGYPGALTAVAVASDGRTHAAFENDGGTMVLSLFTADGGKTPTVTPVAQIDTKFVGRLGDLFFDSTGQYLIGVGNTGRYIMDEVVVWGITAKGLVERHRFDTSVDANINPKLVRGARGGFYVSGASGLRTFDLSTGRITRLDKGEFYCSAFDVSPDEKYLIAAGARLRAGLNELYLLRTATGEILAKWDYPGIMHDVFFHPDGRHVITLNGNGTIYVLRIGPLLK